MIVSSQLRKSIPSFEHPRTEFQAGMEFTCSVFLFLLSFCLRTLHGVSQNEPTPLPVRVGVVLDSHTVFGKMGLSCIEMALSDFYNTSNGSSYKTRLVLYPRNSNKDNVAAASAALDLIKNVQVDAIIGPQTSMQAKFVIDLGDRAQVPIISFSATSPSLCSIRSSYFFQAAQSDLTQVKAISSLVEAFGWRRAVLIYVDDEYGEGIIPFLTDALLGANTLVSYRSVISHSATDDQIKNALYKLMIMQTRVFIVHMLPSLGARIFTKAKEIGMMRKGYVWILTNGMSNLLTQIDPSVLQSMDGVLGVKTYIPKTEDLRSFELRWKRAFQQENPSISGVEPSVFQIWAYDATLALATAVEKLGGGGDFGFVKPNGSTDLDSFGVSQNGPKLRSALADSTFTGLSGEFKLASGRLRSPTFKIINLNGNSERKIGFWTPEAGFRKNFHDSTNESTTTYSISRSNLRPIIWTGDSTSVPKGWDGATNEKKLRIGIPAKYGISKFVRTIQDPETKATKVTGYSIEVFEAVMAALPYAVDYDFISFADANGSSAGSYDDLVYQIFLGKYDAVVGDVTIRANRSLHVDFTLPYTESGVSMVVPVRDSKSKRAWLFLKPLTWDLWVTILCFFVFIGFAVWVLEHKINEEFRGSPARQVGTSFWFSFSTTVFAQKEKIYSNLARFVVVLWVFVVFILVQSYTASLTSFLTVQRLNPDYTNVNELLKSREKVGYPNRSFVLPLLKDLGFQESNLVPYDSMAQCNEFISSGAIVAAIDEIPYIKVLVSSFCTQYRVMGTVARADGFGFAFPKNSSMVADVSRAILKVNEGGKMEEIEKKWLEANENCPDPTSFVSMTLDIHSFWGLFLIAGLVSLASLILFAAMFVLSHKHLLQNSAEEESSVWGKFVLLLRIFDQKYDTDGNGINSGYQNEDVSTKDYYPRTPSTHFPASEFSLSTTGQETWAVNHDNQHEITLSDTDLLTMLNGDGAESNETAQENTDPPPQIHSTVPSPSHWNMLSN